MRRIVELVAACVVVGGLAYWYSTVRLAHARSWRWIELETPTTDCGRWVFQSGDVVAKWKPCGTEGSATP